MSSSTPHPQPAPLHPPHHKSDQHAATSKPKYFWLKLGSVSLLALIAALVSAWFTLSATYAQRYFPGMSVASVPIGGLTENQARTRVEQAVNIFLDRGVLVQADNTKATVSLRVKGDQPELSQDLVRLPIEETLAGAFQYGKQGSFLTQWRQRLSLLGGKNIPFRFADISGLTLDTTLPEQFPHAYQLVQEPSFAIQQVGDQWTVMIQPGRDGRQFSITKAKEDILQALRSLNPQAVVLHARTVKPTLTQSDLQPFAQQVQDRLRNTAHLHLTTTNNGGHLYPIDRAKLAQAITVHTERGRAPSLSFNASLDEWLNNIHDEASVPAINARFVLKNGRVEEFAASKPGQEVDIDATRASLLAAFLSPEDEVRIPIITKESEPEISNEEANDLGLTTLLGTGTSSYRGSPTNRIKNIRHATQKLNGLLIAPGEVFSALKNLQPLTLEDGYFPEMVIKGDEIKPEIAGGLCQIGSTLFRMGMNTGLPILQRQNHSLVVSYYNDARNNQPGTDATLYEPSLDLKFENDTGNYMLLLTEMDEEKKELRYHLWGTSDDRRGSYTPPTVERWTPVGPTVNHYVTDLPVGTKKCQSPHPGATTSFMYTIVKADGTLTEREFRSYYRPLAEQCRIGVTPEEKALRDAGLEPIESTPTVE